MSKPASIAILVGSLRKASFSRNVANAWMLVHRHADMARPEA